MKASSFFAAAALSLVTFAAVGCAAPTDDEADAAESSEQAITSWQNILNVNVPSAGYINTLQTPHLTLRPVRGRFLRMSWPAACNAQITQMSLFGTSLHTGQRLPIHAVLVRGPQVEPGGIVASYYSVNGGAGATVREIGLFGFIGGPCTLAFEQSDSLDAGGGGGGGGGNAISGYDFSGFTRCRPLPSGMACPAIADPVTDACLDRGGRTNYCSDCSVICSVPVN